jgi:amidase
MNHISVKDQQRVRRECEAGRRSRRLRPEVMALEGRSLLSMLAVSNTSASGAGSMRAAVAQAKSDGGGDTTAPDITKMHLMRSEARRSRFILGLDIPRLEAAYASGKLTPVGVLNFYLRRIAKYDQGGPFVNSVPVLDPDAMAEAEADEALIKSGATVGQYPLLGVPIVVKDSIDVASLPTTNGVGALHSAGPGSVTNLVAPQDSVDVTELKAAGAIIVGKGNMSTMAYSGDGISDAFGRVLNPYSPLRTPGGSSSGTAVSVAAGFTMVGIGGETGGSIRLPAGNNADVGLKTSAGLIDATGSWPLGPSRDVLGPVARNVTDIAYAMNAMVQPSPTNIWNNTPFYPSGGPQPGDPGTRPRNYTKFLKRNYLRGKVIALPMPYIGLGKYNNPDPGSPLPPNYPYETYPVDPQVQAAFNRAVAELKALGAKVVMVNIPAFDVYSNTIGAKQPTLKGFPFAYPTTSSGAPDNTWMDEAAAYYYEKQIESYDNPQIKNLDDFYNALKNSPTLGLAADDPTGAVANIGRLDQLYDQGLAAGFGFHVDPDTGKTVPDNPAAQEALQAFANLRSQYYDAFMNDPANSEWGADAVPGIKHIDAFAFPTLNYIAPYQEYSGFPDDTTVIYGALPAGFEANILGVPAITVPMGYAKDGTPMSLEFMGHFDGEGPLIGMAYGYEQHTEFRANPNLNALPVPPSPSKGAL